MRTALLVVVILPLALSVARAAAEAPAAPAAGPRVFVLDARVLAENQRRAAAGDKVLAAAVEVLRRDADKALMAGPFSVTDKKVDPPSGDRHDYMSQAPYWWPDPSKPDGKPYIRRDGEVIKARGAFDNAPMGKMAHAVETLAAAYFFTRHEPYADHAARLVRAWFLDEKTRMNPNLNFGQSIPGVTDGRAAGIIDTTCLVGVVDAVGLLAGSKAWTEADQKGLQAWFEKYAAWLLESKIGRDEGRAKNNHKTWYNVQVAAFALFAGQPDVAKAAVTDGRTLIEKQIEPDGRQPLELERTKSWDYSTMNLVGHFKLAALGDRLGIDLWRHKTDDGRSLRKALDYLAGFTKPDAKWPHKQIKELEPSRLAPVLRQAAAVYGEKSYAETARGLTAADKPDWRRDLLTAG